MILIKRYLLCFLLFAINFHASSQPFSVDYSLKFNYDMRDWGCEVDDMDELPNGNLIIGGNFIDFSQGSSTYNGFIRTDKFGNFDNTFYYYLYGEGDVTDIAEYENGYLINNEGAFQRVDVNGHSATFYVWSDSLNSQTQSFGSGVGKPLVLPRGDIYFSEQPQYYFHDTVNQIYGPHALFHVNGAPKIDANFTNKFNLDGLAFEIKRYDSSHYFLTGVFINYIQDSIPITSTYICRVDTAFNFDTAFHSPFLPIAYGGVTHSYIQNDGKIIVAGYFLFPSGDTGNVVRLNVNGSIDSTFNTQLRHRYNGDPRYIFCTCPTADGGYLMGGDISEFDGYAVKGIVKTDKNGYMDPHYFIGYGADSVCGTLLNLGITDPTISNIKRGMDDKYYLFGMFNYYNGLPAQPIIRLNGLLTSVKEIEREKQQLIVFPNPATEQVLLNIPEGNNLHHYSITLFDINSKPLYTFTTFLTESYIGLKQYPAGIYIIKVRNE